MHVQCHVHALVPHPQVIHQRVCGSKLIAQFRRYGVTCLIISHTYTTFVQVLLHCEPSVLKYTAAIHINDTKYVDNLMREREREREIVLAMTLTHLVLLGISLSLCGLTLSLMRIFMFG